MKATTYTPSHPSIQTLYMVKKKMSYGPYGLFGDMHNQNSRSCQLYTLHNLYSLLSYDSHDKKTSHSMRVTRGWTVTR